MGGQCAAIESWLNPENGLFRSAIRRHAATDPTLDTPLSPYLERGCAAAAGKALHPK